MRGVGVHLRRFRYPANRLRSIASFRATVTFSTCYLVQIKRRFFEGGRHASMPALEANLAAERERETVAVASRIPRARAGVSSSLPGKIVFLSPVHPPPTDRETCPFCGGESLLWSQHPGRESEGGREQPSIKPCPMIEQV